MTNYYSQFIAHYAHKAAPLTQLLKKGAPWLWGPAELGAFESLRAALCSHPVLLLPDLRAHRTFTIETDASDVAIGAVL